LWNFLGIPQGVNKMTDAKVNARGNRPNLERQPPLLRIADPANIASPNPAIATAAKIKADADLAPQKIKALKYLGSVCCGCAKNKDEVKLALMAALDDCTEEVRYEAALALCHCAGNPCSSCNSTGCCDPAVMNKLLKVAEGKDAQGCYLEPSARVRSVAANALNACRNVTQPTTPTPTTNGVEGGTETPDIKPLKKTEGEPGLKPIPEPPAPEPAKTSAAATQLRIIAPANYTEPTAPKAKASSQQPAQWPAAAPLLDARWQRPIKGNAGEK
jgi:hypothetical protein